ncbi:Bacterial extracellular solute-binding protein [compost metagenome]
MRIRLTALLVVILVVTMLFSACSSTKETLQYEGDRQMKATLKVMTNTSERPFKENYGDLFQAKYPNIEIKLINYTQNNYEEVIEKENPDVFELSLKNFKQLLEEDRLYDLNTLMTNDDFDLEGIHPEIVNYVRQLGRGKLYGLTPFFESRAIYYNKDLFDKYQIPYPNDGMTWEEVIQLAKRFPTDNGISGLYIQDFNTFVNEIALSENLKPVNEKEKKLALNTESYRKIFEMIMDAYESKAVVMPFLEPINVYDPFIMGESAMTVDYYYYINNKINWAKEEKGNHLNWELAAAPVDESNREVSSFFVASGFLSVNAESENKQAAWEFVKFINSKEYAKAKSRTNGFSPLARTDYIYNPEGKRMEAFFTLKPDLDRSFVNFDLFPDGFFGSLQDIINSEGKAAMVGAKTLDEAISSMQQRGEQQLERNEPK